ncbi:MAG: M48 family metallopeptidase [Gemmataceae bacterium]|nr:M48 family metallopeptidase [Gemmataceae bacterium]
MPFLLLLLLTLACLQSKWPDPPDWLGPVGSAIATWAGVLVLWAGAAWLTRRHCRRLLQEPGQRTALLHDFHAWRRRHFFALLGFYLFALYFLGWGWTIKNSFTGFYLPGLEILLLLPMVTGLIVSWARFYEMERVAHDVAAYPIIQSPFLSRWAYVALQARHNLLLIVPPLFLLVLQQALFGVFPDLGQNSLFLPLVAVGLLLIAFFSIPFLLRWFLGLRPLPAGELRNRLEATSRRLRFRYNDILVWNTRNTVANAMVTGVFPFARYVVVTDQLIERLTLEELEGVYGHEVGHVKHHHMLFYILFLLTSMVALVGGAHLVGTLLEDQGVLETWIGIMPALQGWVESLKVFAVLPLILGIAVYLFVVFGYLSRRCERQADLYGCRTASTPAFISALEKVAHINGIPRDKPGWLSSWQHGTIEQRVDFLQKTQDDPGLEVRFHSKLGLLKWGVVMALVLVSSGIVIGLGEMTNWQTRMWDFLQSL